MAIEEAHRPEYCEIRRNGVGRAIVRDQKPMDDQGLRRALHDGLSPRDWYKLLNGMVFMWTSKERLGTLMGARAYRHHAHLVLTLSSASLAAEYWEQIRLSPMNSGCTKPYPHPRGMMTFLPPTQYDYEKWLTRRGARDAIVEVAVVGGIRNVDTHLEDARVIDVKGIGMLP